MSLVPRRRLLQLGAGAAVATALPADGSFRDGAGVPSRLPIWVGACAPSPADGSESRSHAIARVHRELSPIRMVRLYSPAADRPATWADLDGADAVDALGLCPFWSTAADYALQVADDRAYVAWLTGFARSLPTDRPCYLTTHHEPEDDGVPPATFVRAYERFYDIVKAVRPDVQVGPVYMTYQWAAGRNVDTSGGPDAWTPDPAKLDFAGADTYCMRGVPIATLAEDERHMRWHDHFRGFGKPLAVPERGLDHTRPDGTDKAIAETLVADAVWMGAHGYSVYLYWQAKGGICELQDANTRRGRIAFRALAAVGRTR